MKAAKSAGWMKKGIAAAASLLADRYITNEVRALFHLRQHVHFVAELKTESRSTNREIISALAQQYAKRKTLKTKAAPCDVVMMSGCKGNLAHRSSSILLPAFHNLFMYD